MQVLTDPSQEQIAKNTVGLCAGANRMAEPKAGVEPDPVQGASYFTSKRFRNTFHHTLIG